MRTDEELKTLFYDKACVADGQFDTAKGVRAVYELDRPRWLPYPENRPEPDRQYWALCEIPVRKGREVMREVETAYFDGTWWGIEEGARVTHFCPVVGPPELPTHE